MENPKLSEAAIALLAKIKRDGQIVGGPDMDSDTFAMLTGELKPYLNETTVQRLTHQQIAWVPKES